MILLNLIVLVQRTIDNRRGKLLMHLAGPRIGPEGATQSSEA